MRNPLAIGRTWLVGHRVLLRHRSGPFPEKEGTKPRLVQCAEIGPRRWWLSIKERTRGAVNCSCMVSAAQPGVVRLEPAGFMWPW